MYTLSFDIHSAYTLYSWTTTLIKIMNVFIISLKSLLLPFVTHLSLFRGLQAKIDLLLTLQFVYSEILNMWNHVVFCFQGERDWLFIQIIILRNDLWIVFHHIYIPEYIYNWCYLQFLMISYKTPMHILCLSLLCEHVLSFFLVVYLGLYWLDPIIGVCG